MEEQDFITDEGRDLWNGLVRAMRDPRNKRGQLGINAVKHLYPSFTFCHDKGMTIEALCHRVRDARHRLENQTVAREIASGTGDPMEVAARAVERLQRNVLAIGYGTKTDVSLADAFSENLDDHDMRQAGVNTSVALWPWQVFNETTGGVQADDYIVFYGRPKSKKSWMLAYFVADIFLQGKTALVYTKEMTARNLFRRIEACLGQVAYQDYRHGRLNEDDRIRMQKVLGAVQDVRKHQDIIILDGKDSQGADTVDWLQAKAEKYKPHVIFVDGMYLMRDNKGGKGQKDNFRVQNISRDLRQMILNLKTPVVATLQANRAASGHQQANLEELAFSDSVGQDATAVLRVINESKHPDYIDHLTGKPRDVVSLVVGGSREWQFSGCRIFADCATSFEYIEALDESEVEKISAKEDKREEKARGEKKEVGGKKKEKSKNSSAAATAKARIDSLTIRTPRRAA